MSTILYLLLLWGNEDPPPGIVDLPEKVEAGAGRLIRIEAKTTGKQIRWHLEGSDPKSGPARALSPVQSILLADGETAADLVVVDSGRMAIFCAPKPGVYRVVAWTATGDVPGLPTLCILDIREKGDLLSTLGSLIAQINPAGRSKNLLALAAVYRKGELLARDRSVATLGELHTALARIASENLEPEALEPVRRKLATWTTAELSDRADELLDGPVVAKAARWFGRVASALETFAKEVSK